MRMYPGRVLANRTAWVVPPLWFIGVTVLSFLPHSAKMRLATRGLFHTPAHIVVFAVTAFMAWRIAKPTAQRLTAYAAVIGYGAVIEVTQSRVNGSAFEWDDLAADIFGAGLALLIIWLARQGRETPSESR
jgi:VanZ family protein